MTITTRNAHQERRRRGRELAGTAARCFKCDVPLTETVVLRRLSSDEFRGWRTMPHCEACLPNLARDTRYEPSKPCDGGCGRMVIRKRAGYLRQHVYCSERCNTAIYGREAKERRAEARGYERSCEICGKAFIPTRSDARTCSSACRQKAYRSRRVRWRGSQPKAHPPDGGP